MQSERLQTTDNSSKDANRLKSVSNPRSYLILPLIFLTGQMVLADGLDDVRQRGGLIWGADQEGGGPFIFPRNDDPQKMQGFEVELAEMIASELGVQAEFKQGQWDKLPELLDRGDIDIVLNGYEWTAYRSEHYGTSIPYYIYELQLLARKDDPLLKSWDDVASPSDRRPKRIAALGGSAAQMYLQLHFGEGVQIVTFDGVTDAMLAVEQNLDGVDANLQDVPIVTFYQNRYPNLVTVGDPVGRGYYVALTRKGDGRLLAEVNRAILAGLQDGRLRKIFEKYRMWNRTQAQRGLEIGSDGGFVGDEVQDSASDVTHASTSLTGWQVIVERGPLLLQAACITVLLSATSMPLAIIIGLLLALGRLYGPWYVSKPATVYVEVIRGTPLVLQLYVIFFVLPQMNLALGAFTSAVIGLAMNYSAYEAEIYRAGIQAVPKGQMEAALALGMSKRLALWRIIIPQATRIVIPPVTNDFIALFKDTAVCSVITIVELSKQYYSQAQSTGAILELGFVTALLYLAMSYPLSLVTNAFERRLQQEKRS